MPQTTKRAELLKTLHKEQWKFPKDFENVGFKGRGALLKALANYVGAGLAESRLIPNVDGVRKRAWRRRF